MKVESFNTAHLERAQAHLPAVGSWIESGSSEALI